jgi:hypothetical protein
MITIQNFREADAVEVDLPIIETYHELNLVFASPEEQELFLGQFRYAWSIKETHQMEIEQILRSPIFFIAQIEGSIVGVLSGL